MRLNHFILNPKQPLREPSLVNLSRRPFSLIQINLTEKKKKKGFESEEELTPREDVYWEKIKK